MEQLAVSMLPFLETLASARIPIVTTLFNLITYLGDEKLFVVIGLIVMWCFSKRGGLYMLTVGFGASTIGQMMKMLIRIPRPWNLDGGSFRGTDEIAQNGWGEDSTLHKLLNKLGGGASDWSFPSGHTLISVGTYGGMAHWFRSKWVKAAGILLCLLIPFTRLYLGVHTPLDIIAGAAVALILVFALRPVFDSEGNGKVRAVLAVNTLLPALLLALGYAVRPAELAGEDLRFYCNGIKNLWQLVGAAGAVWAAFEVDEAGLHYDTKAVWWAQLLKIAGGCVIVLGLMTGIQKVFGYSSDFLTLDNVTRMGAVACVANLVSLIAGAAVWPFTFRWFSRLGYRGKHAAR